MSTIKPTFRLLKPRKRKLLTLKTKVNIVNMFENGEKISQIAKNLNLPNSTVSSIIKDRKRILSVSQNDSVLTSSTIIRKRHGIIAQMECSLKAWCEEHAQKNIRLTQNDICSQAKSIFEALKKDYGEAAKNDTFLASKGWYFRFRHRCDTNRIPDIPEQEPKGKVIPELNVKAEVKKVPAFERVETMEVDVMSTFSNHLKTIVEEGGYSPHTVFNVDEIGIYWKRMPESSNLVYHDEPQTIFNESKDRITLLLGGNAAGDLRLKPLMIYRTENPRALHKKSKAGLPVIWKSNPKASMTSTGFEDWFGYYFIPEVERYCYAHNIPCKVLLVLDSAVYHPPTTLVDFDHRVTVIFLPPRDASYQPMCQEISTVFKAMYTRRIFAHLVEGSRQNDLVNAEEIWRDFNILDSIRIIVDAWENIPEIDWEISWSKLCPFLTNVDTQIDSSTISDIIGEIVNLGLELDMKVSRKDVSGLLESHNKEPTIEELIEMQEYSATEELNVQDPLSENVMTVENLTEALSHIKMGLQILENIDSNEQRARFSRLGVMKLMSAYEDILNEKLKATISQEESGDIPSTSST